MTTLPMWLWQRLLPLLSMGFSFFFGLDVDDRVRQKATDTKNDKVTVGASPIKRTERTKVKPVSLRDVGSPTWPK